MPFKNAQTVKPISSKGKKVSAEINVLQAKLDASKIQAESISDNTEILNGLLVKVEEEKKLLKKTKGEVKALNTKLSEFEKTKKSLIADLGQIKKDKEKAKVEAEKDYKFAIVKAVTQTKAEVLKYKKEQKKLDTISVKTEKAKNELLSLDKEINDRNTKKLEIIDYIKKNEGIDSDTKKIAQENKDIKKKMEKTKVDCAKVVGRLKQLDVETDKLIKEKDGLNKELLELATKKVNLETDLAKRESLVSEREKSVDYKVKRLEAVIRQLKIIAPEKMENIKI